MYLSVCPPVCLPSCMSHVWRPEEGLDPLELDLQIVVSSHVSSVNWTLVSERAAISPTHFHCKNIFTVVWVCENYNLELVGFPLHKVQKSSCINASFDWIYLAFGDDESKSSWASDRQWKLCVLKTSNWLSIYYIYPLIMTNDIFILTCALTVTSRSSLGQLVGLSSENTESETHTCKFYLVYPSVFMSGRVPWLHVSNSSLFIFPSLPTSCPLCVSAALSSICRWTVSAILCLYN